ncbi:hypothetical protein D9M71_576540 [compost metagenome]
MPKLAGFAFGQLAKFPVVAPGLLPTALGDALLGQGMQRVTAEDSGTDTAIQAVQNVIPTAIGDELRDGARPHAAPVSVPAFVPAVDGDLALCGLVVRIGFNGAVPSTEVLEEHRDRIKPWRAGDHQLRDCRALNLQRLGRSVFCGHGASYAGSCPGGEGVGIVYI